MAKAEFLLKLLLLDFSAINPTGNQTGVYTYKHLSVQFILLENTKIEIARILNSKHNYVVRTTINKNYDHVYQAILEELGVNNAYVERKLET